jgi:2-keto-4-pentenoate hydratase
MPVNVAAAAEQLLNAEQSLKAIPPLTEQFEGLSIEDAYGIQTALIQRKLTNGVRITGRKVGLTSKAMQTLLGVSEPDFGHLLSSMAVDDGAAISASELLQPKAEPEIAFILDRDLRGPGVTAVDVMNATRWLMPAIEVVDSRIENWRIKLCDTVADNGSSARYVLGGRPTPIDGLDLRLIGMVFEKNGEIVNTGAGAAILGHPLQAVVWLANKLAELDTGLSAGDVVLPGALTAACDVRAGDTVTATFDRLGPVSVRFT